MTDQTKTCRMCGETIKSNAKRCPHCTSFQSIINFPVVIALIGIAIIIVIRFSWFVGITSTLVVLVQKLVHDLSRVVGR